MFSKPTFPWPAFVIATVFAVEWSAACAEDAAKPQSPGPLLCVAERSDFQATGRYEDVMRFCRDLAQRSSLVTLSEFGRSAEGRSLPLVILSAPATATADQARATGKLVVLAMATMHGGEVCGKEALQMVARDLALDSASSKDLIVLFVPLVNPDGNERISAANRPDQAGPREGVGVRENARGLDLNRDFVKLESPEIQALTRLLTQWDPAVFIDCHTTNGSRHRYALTYDAPRHPATEAELIRYATTEFLPEIGRRVERQSGYKTFFYGNFDASHVRWDAYPALPRFGTQYVGLRQRFGILSEAYAYASFRDRVLATRAFVSACLALCAERSQKLMEVLAKSREKSGKRIDDPATAGSVPLRSQPLATGKFQVAGFVESQQDGHRVATSEPRDYEVEYFGAEQATLSVTRPFAYLFPAVCQAAAQKLVQHGITVHVLREDVELDVEAYAVHKLLRADKRLEQHALWDIDTERRNTALKCAAGSFLVRTDQSLGTLAAVLLEPQSPDGLATWGFFDGSLQAERDYPVVRVPRWTPLLTATLAMPEESTGPRKPISQEVLYGNRPVDFNGSPTSILRWLDDGAHFLQFKDGQLCKVDAASGRCTVVYQPAVLAQGLVKAAGIDEKSAKRLADQALHRLDPQVTAALLEHSNDLYYATLDGVTAARLTDSRAPEELATFSPDGQHVAFVRDDDLYVVDIGGTKERRLTEKASSTVRNGKADWVYYEEVFNRDWRAFRWSPDSQSMAFLEFDDAPVAAYAITNPLEVQQPTETQRFPLAGTANPRVRLGIVRANGGDVQWAKTETYLPDNMLITHFAWMPDSKSLYYYVQDRTQRWLDINRLQLETQVSATLLREQTQAWVDNPGDLTVLADSSFLLLSERDGWKHLYHYGADGTLLRRVTAGEWEVREILACDEPHGRICFSATRDSHLAENLYRTRLDGTELKRLTTATGSHRISANSRGTLFVDSWSDVTRPIRVELCGVDGQTVRVMDTNPVPSITRYQLNAVELVRITLKDGFVVEGSFVKPPDFDPHKKYPVWLLTYGGPHAPSLANAWQGGRTFEQLLAHMGILAFRCDPRSASGKGAVSTWTAYRQLGVQELRDLEEVLDWLTSQPYVDASRIGMSGHSYGGFLTAFALTHSQRFAAGIAGAPVTDWRNYDTVYTERYMLTPQENPDGYQRTSVVSAAKDLHGRLLLIHGARDDNVHMANTLQLVHALQQADQKFELMIYPPDRHGISGPHYRHLMVDFIRRTMLE